MLEIGPGDQPLGNDWYHLDCVQKGFTDWVCRWGEEKLPIEDEAFDLVYSSHCLEHVPWFQTIGALEEVYRILKPRGAFEVWVPDFAYILACYDNRVCGDDWRMHNSENDHMVWINGRVFTYGGPGGLGDPNWHRALFDGPYLHQCLLKAGFAEAKRIDDFEKPRGHDHGPINLGMRAYK